MTVATDPPQTVDVGEEVEVPDHIAGLTCLDEPCPAPLAGGIVTGLTLVGESGPELVSPDQPGVVVPTESASKTSRRRTNDTAEEA